MVGRLAYEGQRTTLFGAGAFDWIDVKRFALEPARLPADAVLELLLADVRFRDTYATAGSGEEDGGGLHGPYRLACVAPASYDRIERDEARATFDAFARRVAPPDDATRRLRLVDAVLAPLLDRADELLRLRDLGDDARHEWGGVVCDFTEVVAIDRAGSTVHLIVAAED